MLEELLMQDREAIGQNKQRLVKEQQVLEKDHLVQEEQDQQMLVRLADKVVLQRIQLKGRQDQDEEPHLLHKQQQTQDQGESLHDLGELGLLVLAVGQQRHQEDKQPLQQKAVQQERVFLEVG